MDLIIIYCSLGILFFFLSFLKTKKVINPLSITSTIWISFLILSNISITGIDIPSTPTQILFLVSITSLIFGGLLAIPNKKRHKETVLKNKNIIFLLILILTFLPLAPVVLNSIKIISQSGYYGFLAATRWGESDVTTSIGSSGLFAFIFNITKPLVYAYFFISVALYFQHNQIKGLILATILMLILAFLLSARAEALVVFFVLVIGFLLNANALSKTSRLFGLFVILAMFSYILIASFTRSGGMLETVGIFERYFIDYHTLGFTMFDKALNDSNSIIHTINSYGMSTFSAIGFTIKQFFRLFGEYYFYPAAELRSEMAEKIIIGIDLQTGELREANAFYTILYPIFADFGYIGLITIPFVFGFFLSRLFISYSIHKDTPSLTLTLFFTWTAYNCLFHPAVVSDFWWFTLLLILIFNNIHLSFQSKKAKCPS